MLLEKVRCAHRHARVSPQDGELQRTREDIHTFQGIFRREYAAFLQQVETAIAVELRAHVADVARNRNIPEFTDAASL